MVNWTPELSSFLLPTSVYHSYWQSGCSGQRKVSLPANIVSCPLVVVQHPLGFPLLWGGHFANDFRALTISSPQVFILSGGGPPSAGLDYPSYFWLCNTFLIRSVRRRSTKRSPFMQLPPPSGSASQLWLQHSQLLVLIFWKKESERTGGRDWIRSLLTR